MTLDDEPLRSEGVQYATGEKWRAITNSSRKNEAVGPKQKLCSDVDVSGGESQVWCGKEHYFIRTWNIKYMNQGTLEMVKEEEMARLNMDILGISELKWTGMGEFNSYDHYIYYCGQESLIAEATEYTRTQCSYMMIVWTEIFLLPFIITFMLFWIALSHWSIFLDTIKHYDNNLKCQLYAKDVKIL